MASYTAPVVTSRHWLIKAVAEAGILSSEQLAAVNVSRTIALWEEIERISGIGEQKLVELVAERLRLPVASLEFDPRAVKVVPEKVAKQHTILPLHETNSRLIVATSDPMDFAAEQAISFASGRTVDFHLAFPRAIERSLRVAYVGDSIGALVAGLDDSLADAVVAIRDQGQADISTREIEAKPIVILTNLILSDAVRDGASDIHIQPVATIGVVRFRIDGVLRSVMQLPLSAVARVISRIKVLAQMNIADRLRPQDGRARVKIKGHEYDLRVSTVPVSGGEKAVIRVLAPALSTKVADLGLPAHETERFEKLLRSRDGIIAVTGPTGSGKTTTLYAALRQLTTGETNIVTVEDPIEYRLAGVSQMQADTKRGVTFAAALRAVLRQDPDVIMIGEVRDEETAKIGAQAAMTGHMVLATLHTNDAVGTIARLIDLGIERTAVADTLRGVVAQRLLRRLCRTCARPITDESTAAEERLTERYGVEPLMRAIGCAECNKTGYRGRLPIVELLVVTQQLQDLISSGGSSGEIQRAAVAGGMRPLLEVALGHAADRLTTIDEIERVLGDTNERVESGESAPPHILIVDDDPVVRELTRFVLNTAGYGVSEVSNGRMALEYLERGDPVSLVVLDLDMPEIDGLAVLRTLRANRATVALPVIVLTGSDQAEAQVMELGGDDYIRKPLSPGSFLSRVKAVLSRASM